MSRRRQGRPLDGILLFDKPTGLSSNQALQRVKRLYGARKAGHTGSLDPLATGLLPICFGQATRVSGLLLDADKHYVVTARLGLRTDSGDAEGEVLSQRAVPELSDEALESALDRFRGEVDQVPPMHSALKVDGERLYARARRGESVERPPRRVTFHEIRLLARDENHLTLRVHCSKGTYIRTLVDDLGEVLGCGAHVVALRRIGVGPWVEPPMHDLDSLKSLASAAGDDRQAGMAALDRVILPPDSALLDRPAVTLDADSAFHVRHGHPVFVPKAPEGSFRMYGPDDLFLGMGEVLDDGRVAPRKLFAAL